MVPNGDRGLSAKSAEPGNASYYYSIPRLAASGRLATPDGDFEVSGFAWLGREWSRSALAPRQAGWDWFALQLSDGRDLMIYRPRDRGGAVDSHSAGTPVEPDGRARGLAAGDFHLDALGHWSSPRGGARYPSRWCPRVPGADVDREVVPALPDQELDLAVR